MDDLDKAFAVAKEAKKPVLAEFTGSDWCPPCIRMHKEVFSKKEFIDKAGRKFVLVQIDIPNGKPEVKEKNQPLLEKHKVRGVPTVILFGPDGKEFDRFGAAEFPSVEAFLARLDHALEKKDMQ